MKSLECSVTAAESAYGKSSALYIMTTIMYTQVKMELAERDKENRLALIEAYNKGYKDGVNSVKDVDSYPICNKTLAESEIDRIKDAMLKCGGNKTKAADMLGISARTIHRKLRE